MFNAQKKLHNQPENVLSHYFFEGYPQCEFKLYIMLGTGNNGRCSIRNLSVQGRFRGMGELR